MTALGEAAGAPHDVALLTRLANEMFAATPGSGVSAAPSASSLPPAGSGMPPGGVPLGGFGATSPTVPPGAFKGAPSPSAADMDLSALLAPLFGQVPGFPALPSGGGSMPAGLPAGAGIPHPASPGVSLPGLSAAIPGDAELRALLAPLFRGDLEPARLPKEAPGSTGAVGATPIEPGKTVPLLHQGATPVLGAAIPSLDIPSLSADIPGEADLRALLTKAPPPDTRGLAGPPAPTAEAPSFYFLDAGGAPAAPQTYTLAPDAHPAFDASVVRADFPILAEQVNGRPLIWLDNAATTQKPNAVIDRLVHFYRHENSNIHRAAHELAARATDAYEHAREAVRRFLGAPSAQDIVFVRGCTEGINLVAKSWGRQHVRGGDEILITWLEHHANIVPWQQLAAETGAVLRVAPVDESGQVRLDEYEKLLSGRTKIVSVSQVSNALGTVTPVAEMVRLARRRGAHVLVDGAQSVSHMPIDVQAMECDWFVFSGHKLFAPTGIGAVYARASVWQDTPPWQGGGNMIRDVTFDKTEYQDPPARFEAGTGNIADAVGLGAAIEYLERIGMPNIARYEHDLLVYATRLLSDVPGLRIIGTAAEKAGVISFVLKDVPPEEVGRALNQEGIAVRAGHHCAQPILRRFGVEATVRPSLAFYNTFGDIDALADAVRRIAQGKNVLF